MIELSPAIYTLIFLGLTVVGIMTGYPVALMLAFAGFSLGFLVLGPIAFVLMYQFVYEWILSYVLLAIPLFVFMGTVLANSGTTDRLYEAFYVLFGRFRGGLAVVTVLFGTVLAACVGVIAATIAMLALLALPAMLKRGYSKSLATGSICAGGTLGILIPPSIMLVLYGPTAGISVGKLFMGAFGPGFVLSGLYIAYIVIRSLIEPKIAPAASIEEAAVPLGKKISIIFSSLVPPVVIVLSVLGTIFFGIAPPTEAAGMGCLATILLSVAYRKFNLKLLKDSSRAALKISCMALLIGALSLAAVGIFMKLGCGKVVESFLLGLPGGRWSAFAGIMFIVFILGMLIDWLPIIFIVVPITAPILPALGFDPLWFAIMVCVNFQMSFMTPPFAFAMFVLKGAAPPELGITTIDIIKGMYPFVGIVVVDMALCVAFPQIILWLPSKMIVTHW